MSMEFMKVGMGTPPVAASATSTKPVFTTTSDVSLMQMVFLAHWVETWNWLLWYIPSLHNRPNRRIWFLPLWPVYTAASLLYMFGRHSFNVVDSFRYGTKVAGRTILLRNFGWHFFVPKYRETIRRRILDAVLAVQAKSSGRIVIGLGALVKDASITDGGRLIIDRLNGRLKEGTCIVHGDTLTAAAVERQVLALLQRTGTATSVFVTGPTSKIGRALVLRLVQRGIHVLAYTSSIERYDELRVEAGAHGEFLSRAKRLSDGQDCMIWVTGKAVPSDREMLPHVPSGAVVLNFAVPNPLAGRRAKKMRPDVRRYEGGLLAYDSSCTDLAFTMRLHRGLTYACHAATIVHAGEGWTHHEVGPVDLNRMDEVWEAALRHGFSLPELVEY